jgi:hypothetical protein
LELIERSKSTSPHRRINNGHHSKRNVLKETGKSLKEKKRRNSPRAIKKRVHTI